jgi:hypothetical protein
MTDIAFFVTGAHAIPNANETLLRERYIEYMIALQKVFHYKVPTFGVLSEVDSSVHNIPPFDHFPFVNLQCLTRERLSHCKTKSQREYQSIQYLNQNVQGLHDDTFIIKLSGRYIPIDDSLVNLVKENVKNTDVQGILCFAKNVGHPLQYTFFFALRWKWFQKFYAQPLEELGMKCVEDFIIEFYLKENLVEKLLLVERLGVLTQINNENRFEIF